MPGREPSDESVSLSRAQIAAEKLADKEREKIQKNNHIREMKYASAKKKQDMQDIVELSNLKAQQEQSTQEYIRSIQSLTVEEYATLMNKAVKDVASEYKKEMADANTQSIKDGILSSMGVSKTDSGYSLDSSSVSSVYEKAISSYTSYQSKVNTRLLGYTEDAFNKIMDSTTKASPFYKTSEYITNVNSLVESGIVQNVEQRAFLETIKDELISTFDATNATLERLVRIQNEDSTVARAGMEAYLNRFLNSTYENTEYITDLFDQTSAALEEATALLSAEDATAIEYVVQKWLGALYSEGMSSTGISAIATAIGQLASGNISDLVGTSTGNLLAMASNGELATYFKDGLTEASANILMESLVNYLSSLNSMGNNVVRSQLAETFGLSISDLKAASNVTTSDVSGSLLSYSQAEEYTGYLLKTAGSRMSTAEIIDNFTDNLAYALGSEIAQSDLLTSLYKTGEIIDDLTGSTQVGIGGIFSSSIGSLFQMGSMIGSIVSLIGDLTSGASFTEGTMLSAFNNIGGLSASASLDYSGVGLESGSGKSKQSGITNGSGSDILNGSLLDVSNQLTETKETITGRSSDEDIEVVVPNIYKYLIDTFDKKMDILVSLNASMANYSVVDSMGVAMSNSMNTIMNGTNVVVTANATESSRDLTAGIGENVANIYTAISKLISGESSLAVRDITTPNGMVAQAAVTAVSGVRNALGVGV